MRTFRDLSKTEMRKAIYKFWKDNGYKDVTHKSMLRFSFRQLVGILRRATGEYPQRWHRY